MSRVHLSGLWLNSGADPSDCLVLPNAGSLQLTPTVQGQVIVLAGGRLRSVSQAGMATQWQVSSPSCSPDAQTWLTSHVAQPVWVRDIAGRRVYGVFFSVQIAPIWNVQDADVSFTLDEVTS